MNEETVYDSGDEKIYKAVEEPPVFFGCKDEDEKQYCSNKKFLMYIYANLRFEVINEIEILESMIVLSFVIEKDGSVSSVSVIQGQSLADRSNIQDVLEGMPRWGPAVHKGEFKRFRFHLPIRINFR